MSPRRFGRYEIVGLLGEGGQAAVYHAVRHGPGGLSHPVALKIFRDAGVRQEGRLGGLLRHVHLVDVYEVGEAEGVAFVAMALCAGGSVARLAPLPPRAVVEVGLQVCAALQYAHEELGLVHGDLKPANLLLDDARVLVADLGIARAVGFDDVHRGGGTPGYMPPEQARGGRIDARADVHALGVTLVELATGVRPELSSATWVEVAEAPAVAPAAGPAWLAPVVDRCLAPDPEDRYPSMSALAAALRALPADGPGLSALVARPRPAPRTRTNLTGEADAFVGRGRELAELAAAVRGGGVATVRGPAGIGKTRLARRLARRLHDEEGVEAWFCDLAGARDLPGLLTAVAGVLDVPLPGADLDAHVDQIGRALAGRGAAVVVLDNLEQLGAHARVLARWSATAPRCRLVATSREALGLTGERILDLDVLPPDDAGALVVARALERGVEIEAAASAELARRLDGLPLALELAAGRLGVLSSDEVIARSNLPWLRSGRADAPARQSTLAEAIGWSVALLDPHERAALGRLSVFAGGATLEAVEALDAHRALEALVARSLVRVDRERGRFSLLAPIREYAASLLDDAARAAAETAHFRWFERFGTTEALRALDAHGGTARRLALGTEAANLALATWRAILHDEPDAAARCALAAGIVAVARGPAEQGAALVEAALAAGPSPRLACELLRREVELRLVLGHSARAVEASEAAVALADEIGALDLRAAARVVWGQAHMRIGRGREALGAIEDAVAFSRAAGWRLGEGLALSTLGLAHLELSAFDAALRAWSETLVLARECGHRRLEAVAIGNTAIVEARRGRWDEARAAYTAAIAIAGELQDRGNQAIHMANLGILHDTLEEWDAGAALLDAALAIQREIGHRRDEGRILGARAALRMHQGRFDDALADFEQALAIHREVRQPRSEAVDLTNLGVLLGRRGDLAGERRAHEAALLLAEGAGDRALCGAIQGRIADHLRRAGEPEAARRVLDEAEATLRAHGAGRDLVHVHLVRGWLALDSGDLDAARAALRETAAAPPGYARSEIAALADAVGDLGRR